MMKFIPQESPKVRPAVLDYIRQFARQFQPINPVGA